LRLPEASARFLREARASVAIQSEHVARVLDVGTMETGAPFMVMEYLAGTDFSRLLRERGYLPVDDAVDFLLQAGEAIAEAHLLGIVHRDLKPSNLFLTSRSEGSPLVKVLDFGLSKMLLQDEEAVEGSLTATTVVVGSPQYMSPEQIRSLKHVGFGADIWALGVILHEMLTGRRPFVGRTLTAISASIAADTPPPLRSLRPELPDGLDAVVLACLEKDMDRRVQTVADLASLLAPFAPPRSSISLERIAKLTGRSRSDAATPGHDVGYLRAVWQDQDDAPTRAIVTGAEPAVRTPAQLEPIADSAILPVSGAPLASSAPLSNAGREPRAAVTGVSGGQTKPQGRRIPPAAFAAGLVACIGLLAAIGWLAAGGREGAQVAAAGTEVAVSTAAPSTAEAPHPPAPPVVVTPEVRGPAATAAPSATSTASARAATPPVRPAAVAPPPSSTGRPVAPHRHGGNPLDRSD
jgi:serine/threonine-protein kinase